MKIENENRNRKKYKQKEIETETERNRYSMKYVYQFGILAGICFAAELLYRFIPLPVPASVYGLLLLLGLLITRILRVEQVEGAANFLLLIMPILFISPSVSLITSLDLIKGSALGILLMAFLSTMAVLVVTGRVSQFIIGRRENKKRNGEVKNE